MSDDEQTSGPFSTPPEPAPAPRIQGHWVLLLALGAAVAAAVSVRGSPAASPQNASAPVATSVIGAHAPLSAADEPDKAAISGTIVERLEVPKYTYLRLATGAGETWAAVASTNAKVGEAVRVVDAQLMTSFVSATLKRTFERIYFGALADGTDPAADAARADADPHGMATGVNPHTGAGVTNDSVAVDRVVKAEGKNGRRVAELFAQRATLKDQTVRVRGVVVKVIAGVLDRSFVHLRDGSEKADVKDLVVTTRATPALGEHVLFEGTVKTDEDFGAGYVYPVLLADATRINE